jgi:hypothetical protein
LETCVSIDVGATADGNKDMASATNSNTIITLNIIFNLNSIISNVPVVIFTTSIARTATNVAVNRIPVIRYLPLRVTPIFSNKTHALNTLKMGCLLTGFRL